MKKLTLLVLFILHVIVLINHSNIAFLTKFNNWFGLSHDLILAIIYVLILISFLFNISYLFRPKHITFVRILSISMVWILCLTIDSLILLERHEKIFTYKEMSCDEYKLHLKSSDNKIYLIDAGGIACFDKQICEEFKQNYNIDIIAICEKGCFGAGILSCKEKAMIEYLKEKNK